MGIQLSFFFVFVLLVVGNVHQKYKYDADAAHCGGDVDCRMFES